MFALSPAGASVLEEIHCGHRAGQLRLHGDQEGRRGEAEGEEEGEEAASQDELQVGFPPPSPSHPPSPSLTLSPSLKSSNDEVNLWPLSEIEQRPIDVQGFHLETNVSPNLRGTCMNQACLSSSEIWIFFIRIIIFSVTYQRKINSNQQIGLGGAVCQTPDPTAIILSGCHSVLEAGRVRLGAAGGSWRRLEAAGGRRTVSSY